MLNSRKTLSLSVLSLAALLLISQVTFAKSIKHHFIAVDNGENQLVEIDQFNKKQRVFKLTKKARDITKMSDDTLLLSLKDGFALFDYKKWEMKQQVVVDKGIESATLLSANEVLLTQNKKKKSALIKTDLAGNILKKWPLPQAEYLRLIRVNKDGLFLLTSIKPYRIVVIDPKNPDASAWQEIPLAGKGYKVEQNNQSYYATTGETVTLDVLDKKGKLINQYGGVKAHPEANLLWFSGFTILNDKSVIVANWLGHGKNGQGPHLVKFDKNNQLTWQWTDHKLAKQITNFILLK